MKDSKQILLSYIDCSFKQDIYYGLAIMLLEHVSDIQNYNINKVAQLCYVSTSTLSRFCRKLGFENYNEFKNGFDQKYKLINYTNDFLQQSTDDILTVAKDRLEEIHALIDSQLDDLDISRLDRILERIYESQTILFLGHQLLQFYGSYLQQNLLRYHKLSYSFYQEADQIQFIGHMSPRSLVIILSVDGSYHIKHAEIIALLTRKKVTTVVITQNPSTPLIDYCTDSLIIKGTNKNDVGKYGMLFLIDLMMLRYKLLYPGLDDLY
jgi:RpiR family carbohydrate utilization transcriptional regulator